MSHECLYDGNKLKSTWGVLRNRKNGDIFIANLTEQPHYKRESKYRGNYEILAQMPHKEDAELLAELKLMDVKADFVEYLRIARSISSTVDRENSVLELEEHIEQVRKETDRDCFGQCQSLEGHPACYNCFTTLRQTWTLCSTIRCFYERKQDIDNLDAV